MIKVISLKGYAVVAGDKPALWRNNPPMWKHNEVSALCAGPQLAHRAIRANGGLHPNGGARRERLPAS
jgi:hypothetical protein